MKEHKQKVTRPGPGWKHIGGAVYEHISGIRLHLFGLVKLPNGKCFNKNNFPECKDAERAIRLSGGNLRRGLMSWAITYNDEQ